MLSGKLIHLVEMHEEELAAGIIRAIRRDPELSHLGRLPDAELRERGSEILKNLGHWMSHGHEAGLAHLYEAIGKTRFQEAVPLHESIRGLCIIKDRMLDFIGEQGLDQDTLSLYAEEEFDRRLGRFFDLLIVHLARGYESAWHHATHATA